MSPVKPDIDRIGSKTRLTGLFLLLTLLVAPLAGCAAYGPGLTRTSHLAYNEAVQVSAQQELLLNLVRLRYTDAPEFLAINSISAQMSFDLGASLDGDFGEVEDSTSAFIAPGISAGYSERPTLSFTPERGAEFTRQLVAPVGLDSLYLLTQYGWSLERVLRLVATDINGIRNTINRELASGDQAVALRSFAELAGHLGQLQNDGAIQISVLERREVISPPLAPATVSASAIIDAANQGFRYTYLDDSPSLVLTANEQYYVLHVVQAARSKQEFSSLAHRLGIKTDLASYDLDPAGTVNGLPADQTLRIATRSVLGVMAYLSQAVQVPRAHVDRGWAIPEEEVQAILSDVLTIRVTDQAPDKNALSVPYRGRWFYIEDSDLNSKRTLGLLTSLCRLQIRTGGAQNVPVLTLPVSR